MKGYKAFDKDLKCRGLQFKVGETTSLTGKLEICKNGIHFCEKLNSVFDYYPKNYDTRVCEIETNSEVITENDKSVTLSINLVRELTKDEIKALTDDLKFNSGNYNSGRYNSGDNNSGNYNSGRYNSGHYNSGYYNSGHYNSGRYNSGNYNSGRYNSGDNNSGYYNIGKSKIKLFNKDSDLYHDSEIIIKFNAIIDKYWKPHLTYILTKHMTEIEKTNNPSHLTTGGFLRLDADNSYKKSWGKVWAKCSETEQDFIKSLPNFDAEIFLDITGIDVRIEQVEVTVNGKTKKISKADAEKLGLI